MADSIFLRCTAASRPLPARVPEAAATRDWPEPALAADLLLAADCALLLPILVVLAADAVLTAAALPDFVPAARALLPREFVEPAFVPAAVLRAALATALAVRDTPALLLTPADGFWAGAAWTWPPPASSIALTSTLETHDNVPARTIFPFATTLNQCIHSNS